MQEEEIAEPLRHEGEAHGTAAFAEDVGAAEFPQGIQHALKIEGSVLPLHADDTHAEVAQGGKNLSGGQRQRLTIARALVPHPQVLILDDSSSALDFATDAALRKALKEQTHGMTVFIVSQRASAVQRADRILVLDDGNLVGSGTHANLLKTCDVYREICLSQLSREEVEKTL